MYIYLIFRSLWSMLPINSLVFSLTLSCRICTCLPGSTGMRFSCPCSRTGLVHQHQHGVAYDAHAPDVHLEGVPALLLDALDELRGDVVGRATDGLVFIVSEVHSACQAEVSHLEFIFLDEKRFSSLRSRWMTGTPWCACAHGNIISYRNHAFSSS